MAIGLLTRPLPLTLASGNDAGPATLVAFPKTNLLNNEYGRVWKTASAAANSTVILGFDLGRSMPIDVLGLFWHNMRVSDRLRWTAGDTVEDSLNGVLYSGAAVSAITGATTRDVKVLAKCLQTLSAPITARYWHVRLQTLVSANPDGFVQGSRIVIGLGAQFVVGAQKVSLGAVDLNAQVTTEVGETRTQEDSGLIRPVASMALSYARKSEVEQMLGGYTLSVGVSKTLLVCPDLTNPYLQDSLVLGRPERVVSYDSDTYDTWSFEAVVTSIGP